MYWAMINMGSSHDEAIKNLDSALSKSSNVYHASQALYVKGLNSTVVATAITRLTKFEWSEYTGQFSKNKKSIKEGEGEFRRLFTTKSAIKANKVVFFAHGHKDKILFLLNSLVGVGRNAHSGFGEIGKIKITEVIEDNSWFYNDKLNRILPTNIFFQERNEPVRECRYKPNYSVGETINCYIPTMNTVYL
ncbi:hypothetical protein HLH17_14575 [Acinetobacter sp. ANC 5380]|uniref:Uncharacterized protein n=2 Tax=Acinetobacter terrae TaxID=2731247 RepID=A0A7Y2WBW0_9GAMM|nr:hypothetical protein [Acinetobacter terrae]